jgi:hypothetical protein
MQRSITIALDRCPKIFDFERYRPRRENIDFWIFWLSGYLKDRSGNISILLSVYYLAVYLSVAVALKPD